MSQIRRPATLTAAAVLLGTECLMFAALIGVFVYRTLNYVPGYDTYYFLSPEQRTAALAEAIVIGFLLVIAGILLAVSLPALLRGEHWARISMMSIAGGLIVYPTFLAARAIVDPIYVDWWKIVLTFLGAAGALAAIMLLSSAPTSRYFASNR